MPPTLVLHSALLEASAPPRGEALRRLRVKAGAFAMRSAGELRPRAAGRPVLMPHEIQADPLRTVLLAAGSGMPLTLLVRLLMRR